MNKTVKILVVEPGYKPYVTKIEDSLRDFQNVVEGCIEAFYPFANESIVCFCNDEGLINGFTPNWAWYNRDVDKNNPHSILCGTFFAVGDDGKGGNRSLTEKEIEIATNLFSRDRIVPGIKDAFVLINKPEILNRYLKTKKEGKTNERNCD